MIPVVSKYLVLQKIDEAFGSEYILASKSPEFRKGWEAACDFLYGAISQMIDEKEVLSNVSKDRKCSQ